LWEIAGIFKPVSHSTQL